LNNNEFLMEVDMRAFISSALSLALVTTSVAGIAPAAAQTAAGLGDLIGARGSSAESELTSRGYKFEKNMGSAALWWNSKSNTCVSVAVDNGRVASIQTGTAKDCGKSSGSDQAIAGVAAGALAVGLIAALSGHHKNSENRNNTASYNGEYQRGYNDGMYSSHYATNDSEAYHSGYMAGEAERNNRRYANSSISRGLPAEAGNACISKGEYEWGVPPGSVSVVSSSNYSPGNYEVTLATGHWRATCKVTAFGQVTKFKAN
jgi:hypothetical protein